MAKILYVIIDGLGDVPNPTLGGKTPLEAARTPSLDRLAQRGVTGIVHPVEKGLAIESDVAALTLLGYDYRRYYTGRGPLEAAASGMELQEGDVALRTNFARVASDGATLLERRCGKEMTDDERASLVRLINSEITLSSATFEFKNTSFHRGVLRLRGMHTRLSGLVSNTDPAYERQGCMSVPVCRHERRIAKARPLASGEEMQSAEVTAGLLNEFTEKVFAVLVASPVNKKRLSEGKTPVNAVIARGAGSAAVCLPSLESLWGVRFGCFVEMPLERGIARLSGMHTVEVPSSSGHPDVDYAVWAKVALETLASFDGLYVHIKELNEPSHDGDGERKHMLIECIDTHFFQTLLKKLDLGTTVVAVTSDHTVSSLERCHTADPVPLIISGATVKPDGTLGFSEKACRLGSLGEMLGKEILPLLVKTARE